MKKNTKTFTTRGAVRKFMNRVFQDSAGVEYIYGKVASGKKAGRFYPIVTAVSNKSVYAIADDNFVVVDTSIVTH